MYTFIRGILISADPTHAVLEAGGIGYHLFIPASQFQSLPSLGEKVLLHTSFVVRDTGHALYGFLTTHDRNLFETLTHISGIGPKTALGLIGNLPAGALQEAISADDPKILAKVPGVGKKTAERLVMELRDKLPSILPNLPSSTAQDATTALVKLGYGRLHAQKAVSRVLKTDNDSDLSTLITAALKELG